MHHMISYSMLWVRVNMKFGHYCESQSTWNISHDIIISVVSPSQNAVMMMLWVPVNIKYIEWYDIQCFESESTWNTDDVVGPSQHEVYHMIL